MTAGQDARLVLPDGRVLCYAELGNPGGTPVVLVHGAPGYRRYWTALPGFPFAPGLRLIAPDRPGYGLSDYRPGLRYQDWPDDLATLADRLGVDRFAVAAGSGGGPFALACAWRLAERVTRVALVSTVGPPTPEILEAVSRPSRVAYRVARRAPGLMRLNMRLLAAWQRRDLDGYLDRMSGKLSDADRAALARPAVRRALRAAMSADAVPAHARGYAQDVILQSRPWSFPLPEVRCPVHLWQPEDDTSTPPAVARHLARVLPRCTVHYVPDAGHFWHLENLTAVLDDLVA